LQLGGVAGAALSACDGGARDGAMAADVSAVSWEETMIGYFEVGFNPKLDLPDMMAVGRRRLE
jgi:hypothetical protein